ncbi:uncharacterized protein LOC142321627 [Lycorma delicatula]|uniref:uncharacterized protein LOC142321627 n=1 Tax=Lycorma delicatula TaxID=130591 RepID=UPI003F518CFD
MVAEASENNDENFEAFIQFGLCVKGHKLHVLWANTEHMKQKQDKKQHDTNVTYDSENVWSRNLNQNSSKGHRTYSLNGRSSGRYEKHHAKEELSQSCDYNPLESAGATPVNNNDYQCNNLVSVQFRSSATQASMPDQFLIPSTIPAVVSDNFYNVAKQILKICNFKLDEVSKFNK